MSSTTSSDRLTLLSYATFNYHILIHDHSDSTWRQHQWKLAETMIALAISLIEWQEALSERQFGKQTCDTYFSLELTFAHEALVLIPKHLGDVTDFFLCISFENEI